MGGEIILATETRLPEPDFDEAPLRAALAAAGVPAQARAWDDPSVDWAAARAVIIRATWNYIHNHETFLAWAERCAGATALWNPLPAVRWNIHKKYLVELAERGLPVVPTRLVPRGPDVSLADIVGAWQDVVIKPAVSAGSFGTIRVTRERFAEGQRHLEQWAATRDMLVQPYQTSVESHGERACVWIDGAFTHAIRKNPRLAADDEHVSDALPIAAEERATAERILAAVPWRLLYARIDLARGVDGQPTLMELELIEPSLFLDRSAEACAAMAAAIARL